jgi:hypothetical protein
MLLMMAFAWMRVKPLFYKTLTPSPMIALKKPVSCLAWLCFWLSFALPLHADPDQALAERPTVTLYMTVDWEGWSLEEENLQAMRDFRVRHPHIPMLHLLNPVYAMRPGMDMPELTQRTRSTFLPGDGEGLHLHGWRTLVEACGLPYRSEPAFSEAEGACSQEDCGYNVSLESAYSESELHTLVACSSEQLMQQGFRRSTHFRAGGWQLGPKLADALQANGFSWDSSRIDPRLLLGRWHADSALIKLLETLHPDATALEQPRKIRPGLMQYPNNAALADYTSASDLLAIFQALAERAQKERKEMIMVLGFHQETADHYLPRLDEAIRLMTQEAAMLNVEVRWAAYPEQE